LPDGATPVAIIEGQERERGEMAESDMTPKVAPYDACVGCYRGDTTTAVAAKGEAEFIVAAIHRAAGIPIEEAQDTFLVIAEQEMGCEPGTVPKGTVTTAIRLCPDCASKTGTKIGSLHSGELPLYSQSEGGES
jgi:hypothetical protein